MHVNVLNEVRPRINMPITGDELKAILRNYPTGVTIVTTTYNGVYYGLTVNSFTSISLNPPLVMIAIDKRAASHDAIAKSGIFAVNILPYDMADLAVRFATAPQQERFKGLEVFTARTGAPIIKGSLAYLDCRVYVQYEGGDHTIFLGLVEEGKVLNNKKPLIYYNRSYLTIP